MRKNSLKSVALYTSPKIPGNIDALNEDILNITGLPDELLTGSVKHNLFNEKCITATSIPNYFNKLYTSVDITRVADVAVPCTDDTFLILNNLIRRLKTVCH